MGEFGEIDLDVLRGWRHREDPELRRPHALPALARLVHLKSGRVESLRGPDLLVGRYYPQNGPVDLLLGGLKEHELYRLGAPHLQMTMDENGQWSAGHLAPGTHTSVGPDELRNYNQKHLVSDGDVLTLGSAQYRFERASIDPMTWKNACKALLTSAEQPSLFMCRNGAPCGPKIAIPRDTVRVLGRTLPPPKDCRVHTPWGASRLQPEQPDVDLAGLYPDELKYIGYLHASIRRLPGAGDAAQLFELTPLAPRQKTFINRQEISEPTLLYHGDELALGSVFFYLYCPDLAARIPRRSLEPPTLVDWSEGAPPRFDEAEERS